MQYPSRTFINSNIVEAKNSFGRSKAAFAVCDRNQWKYHADMRNGCIREYRGMHVRQIHVYHYLIKAFCVYKCD